MNGIKEERNLFSILGGYAGRHRNNLILTIVGLLINTGLTISAPFFFQQALEMIELVEFGGNTAGLTKNLVIALTAYFLLTVLSWFSRTSIGFFSTRLNAGIIADIRLDTFRSLLSNPMAFFDRSESGNTVSILTNDMNELYSAGNAIAEVLTAIFRLIGILVLLVYYSVILTLSSLFLLPIFFVVTLIIRKYRRRSEMEWRRSFGRVNQSFAETLRSIEVSKAFNREEENIENFRVMNEATYRASIRRGAAIFISQPIADFLRNVLLIMILAVGVYAVSNLGLSIANFYLFIFLMDFYYNPVRAIARNYNQFQTLFANLERVLSISNTEETGEEGKQTLDDFSGRTEFKSLSFSYGDEINVLDDISFDIQPGRRVALVGHTGSGKSTIANLLMRYYNYQHGDILLDGQSIREYTKESVRSAISVVSQDVLLFKGTIKENLQIGNPHATEDEMWDAIDAVQAREFIDALPQGLETKITEDAKNLSTGQRQIISFARTLLSKPRLILLDEATSSVDLYTEAKIQQATDLLLQNTTSLVIAHRLTTIIRSDLIVVLEEGRIVEKGTHGELMERNGAYKEMYDLYFQTQSAKYLENVRRSD